MRPTDLAQRQQQDWQDAVIIIAPFLVNRAFVLAAELLPASVLWGRLEPVLGRPTYA